MTAVKLNVVSVKTRGKELPNSPEVGDKDVTYSSKEEFYKENHIPAITSDERPLDMVCGNAIGEIFDG
ncbi:hypothetical protein ACJJI5_05985 [Microbulbifer sp. EKSA008]|uniref:hypothetical protein n=1 Tax=Microbulbifer sp. EKSA008 TaxID=3243367 RepID=UPI004042ED0C